MKNSFLLKKYFACTVFALFFRLYFCLLPSIVFLHFAKNCGSRYERRDQLLGCAGCVTAVTGDEHSPISIFRRMKGIFVFSVYLFVFSIL